MKFILERHEMLSMTLGKPVMSSCVCLLLAGACGRDCKVPYLFK